MMPVPLDLELKMLSHGGRAYDVLQPAAGAVTEPAAVGGSGHPSPPTRVGVGVMDSACLGGFP
jgi:hypothetical protein